MGILLLFRCILASVATLALSHAAIAQETQCPTYEGKLFVHISPTSGVQAELGYVKPASMGYSFGVTTEDSAATFSLTGCKNANPVQLRCTNCDASGDSVVAVYNSDLGADGNTPSDWVFYNAGPNPEWNPKSISFPFVYSSYFTWGEDDVIRPVTYNFNGDNQEIALNAEYHGADEEIVFISGTENGVTYSITWE